MPNTWSTSQWLQWAEDLAPSRATIEGLGVQLILIGAILAIAWGLRLTSRTFTDCVIARIDPYIPSRYNLRGLRSLVWLAYAWLLLVIVERAGPWFGFYWPLVGIAATLAALWIVLRATTLLFRDALLARIVAIAAWTIAALDITGLLAPTAAALDSAALTIGTVRLSLLLVAKAALLVAILLWAALAIARLLAVRIAALTDLSPSVQTLASNLVRIALVFLALLVGLNAVGINLTAFTVLSGAIGVGLGIGLQKIVSNFICGIILLAERSIKPGDVIEAGNTHGSVTALGARYTAVRGRDGKEYLIPNESLITNQVVNWSYTNTAVRLDITFGISYDSDPHLARQVAVEVTRQTARVLPSPEPVCHLTAFGDSSVDFILRFWINDPMNGVVNVRGDILLAIWDAFHERGIELPFPQRDVHIRDLPAGLFRTPEGTAPQNDPEGATARPAAGEGRCR